MAVQDRFERNLRPSAVESDEESFHTETEDLLSQDEQEGSSDAATEDEQASEGDEESQDDEDVGDKLNAVSFGALKKANDSLSRKRKAGDAHGPDQEAKVESLKKRLQLIKQEKAGSGIQKRAIATARPSKAGSDAFFVDEGGDSNSDSDSAPEEISTKGRAKHAPAAQSSKYQVSRKRQVIDVPKRLSRDPRFDAVAKSNTTTQHRENAYGFLREYQKSEMQELKAAMKKAGSEEEKTTLRRTLNAMENRLKAREAKEREQDVVRKHRKQEREQVKEGKTPYYLKRSEIKQQALVDKYDSMKSKDRERLMDRRRKKESQKEKKRMPDMRRRGVT